MPAARIGLLQAGYVHPDVARDHGDYPELFADLLRLGGLDAELVTYDLQRDGGPTTLDGHDGWIISGSVSSAYEDEDWIRDLERLSLALLDRDEPVVGICFGHQVLARATGGQVEKAAAGWGVGVHDYHLTGPHRAWTGGLEPDPVRMVASHQDQVVELPDGAEPFLTSPFCPNAGFTLGSDAMTIQAHPEFTPAVSAELIGMRRAVLGDDLADAATATLPRGTDNPVVARWITTFLGADR
ncbi:MAG: hypothetical protein KF906_04700 [Actinobacteria bacterium]|nr:hypothetical protein [Actinomycetota bacterium]